MAEYKSCIVKDCTNRSDQGEFVGDLCGACYAHLTTGKVGPTLSILRKIRDAELFILKGPDGKIVTQGQFNALVAENAALKERAEATRFDLVKCADAMGVAMPDAHLRDLTTVIYAKIQKANALFKDRASAPVNYEITHEQTAKEINKALDKAGVKGLRAVAGMTLVADLLHTAWGIIANAHGGDWAKASAEWSKAAHDWRDEFHAFLKVSKEIRESGLDQLMFAELRGPNMDRCDRYFQTCKDWTISDWLMAITGELGELANVLKKIRRGDFTVEDKRGEIAKEIADVNIYLDLLSAKLGIDLGKAIREKFNEVSDRRHCPIKL